MSVYSVAEQFVELCNQSRNFDVMRTLYHPDIVSVEGDGRETVGQEPVIQKSEQWVVNKTINSQTLRGPFYNGVRGNDGEFAIHFVHNISIKPTDDHVVLEEVAIYTVKNDLITREQFFFAGQR